MLAIPPNVVGLIFADRFEADVARNEMSLIGLFQARSFSAFPSDPLEMIVFAMVNSGRGEGTLQLGVYPLKIAGGFDPAVDWIYRQRKWIKFPNDPNITLSLEIRLTRLVFLEPGEYLFVLTFDDKFLADRRMSIRER